ncbi:HNH endonuclease [Paracoccus sp. AK26]|uniref:HNH endonuclease n=1 Tax=Paracoccus sp. AK26 TaxID=2589076 RepID=UPI00142F406B|nr:HNH endonuclease signature motif containing protein [Paracoccus sp. AK26]
MKQLAPRGRQLKPRGQSGLGPGRARDRVDTWRAWYKTAEWRAIRWEALVSAYFTCVRCGLVYDSANLVGDHKRPHRGNRELFFDRTNVQCMCADCHNRHKQREERANAYRGD